MFLSSFALDIFWNIFLFTTRFPVTCSSWHHSSALKTVPLLIPSSSRPFQTLSWHLFLFPSLSISFHLVFPLTQEWRKMMQKADSKRSSRDRISAPMHKKYRMRWSILRAGKVWKKQRQTNIVKDHWSSNLQGLSNFNTMPAACRHASKVFLAKQSECAKQPLDCKTQNRLELRARPRPAATLTMPLHQDLQAHNYVHCASNSKAATQYASMELRNNTRRCKTTETSAPMSFRSERGPNMIWPWDETVRKPSRSRPWPSVFLGTFGLTSPEVSCNGYL